MRRATSGDRVTVPVREELRRRLGATFTAADLADLYGAGTDWVLQLPGIDPALSDLQELIDAIINEGTFGLEFDALS